MVQVRGHPRTREKMNLRPISFRVAFIVVATLALSNLLSAAEVPQIRSIELPSIAAAFSSTWQTQFDLVLKLTVESDNRVSSVKWVSAKDLRKAGAVVFLREGYEGPFRHSGIELAY